MPRALRIEYPGAIYHVMNRGDRRGPIFRDDLDHKRFVATLAKVCTKTDWQFTRSASCTASPRITPERGQSGVLTQL